MVPGAGISPAAWMSTVGRRVNQPLHLLINGLGHRAQRLGTGGGQQQVAAEHQRVGAGFLRRIEHPHIVGALFDLHLVDEGGLKVLMAQRPGQIPRPGAGRRSRHCRPAQV